MKCKTYSFEVSNITSLIYNSVFFTTYGFIESKKLASGQVKLTYDTRDNAEKAKARIEKLGGQITSRIYINI